MAVTVLTPNNLGSTIDTVSEPAKFNAKIDNTTIVRAADGTLSAPVAALPRYVTSVTRTGDTLVVSYSDSTTANINVCCT